MRTAIAILSLSAILVGCGAEQGSVGSVPVRSDKELIFDAVLNDILTNPGVADSREFYGTPGQGRIALVSSATDGVPWPDSYQPAVHGYVVEHVQDEDRSSGGDGLFRRDVSSSNRLLGVRIDKLNLVQKTSGMFDAPIEITLFNAGGNKNGAVIGGCSLYYRPERDGSGWRVEFMGSMDP